MQVIKNGSILTVPFFPSHVIVKLVLKANFCFIWISSDLTLIKRTLRKHLTAWFDSTKT